jgi:hypothetical protein
MLQACWIAYVDTRLCIYSREPFIPRLESLGFSGTVINGFNSKRMV